MVDGTNFNWEYPALTLGITRTQNPDGELIRAQRRHSPQLHYWLWRPDGDWPRDLTMQRDTLTATGWLTRWVQRHTILLDLEDGLPAAVMPENVFALILLLGG